MRRIGLLAFVLVLLPGTAHALLELDGKFVQGGVIVGRTEPDARVTIDGRSLKVRPDGRFLIGLGRDQGVSAALVVTHADGRTDEVPLQIEQRDYAVERIDGLPEQMVTPDQAVLTRIAEEKARVEAARVIDSAEPRFDEGFVWPAIGPVSGVYGSQRILNGEPRQPHFGVDIAAAEGTPVGAAASGSVVLAADLYFTGNTVIIDHGWGFSTTYSHLSDITVAVGDEVRQSQQIGTLGGTGRATGPHLDWRLNLLEVRLDPALFVGPMPEPDVPDVEAPAGQ
jgi:murein DD-endopeptidase MepM/ murein hydrolase activator NlpD